MNRFFRIPLLVLLGLGLLGCGSAGNSWHQKLTVTVMTPQGEVSGSSVTDIYFAFKEDGAGLVTGYAYRSTYRGEAVVVEVAPGKYLFAPLDPRFAELAFKAFLGDQQSVPVKATANAIEAMRKRVDLGQSLYPLLVTFTDIANPRSVKEVKPGKLDEAFGPGYSLQSITLEITDEPVTNGSVEKVAPWLGQENPIFIDWKKYPIDHPLQNVNKLSFLKGF
jgi:hypothetical protein